MPSGDVMMMTYLWSGLWLGLAVLVVVGGVSLARRVSAGSEQPPPQIDDDAVRRIVETGTLVTDEDEPLDLEEIAEEERRFWSESWDEPVGPGEIAGEEPEEW